MSNTATKPYRHLLEDAWLSYVDAVMKPMGANDLDLFISRRIFFSGAHAFNEIASCAENQNPDSLSDVPCNAEVQVIMDMTDEIQEFILEVRNNAKEATWAEQIRTNV